MDTASIHEAFREQAALCERLGSPFTARLLEAMERLLDNSSLTARAVVSWEGRPDALGDALPLRVAGALHALSFSGRSRPLASIYPPYPTPPPSEFRRVLAAVLLEHDEYLRPWLDEVPQTNEVSRSLVLYPGLMAVAKITGLPLNLYEFGAGAGLNLILDRYAYKLGNVEAGDPQSSLVLGAEWKGPSPVGPLPRVVDRYGCDRTPIDITSAEGWTKLRAYIWPDQKERHQRLVIAAQIARSDPPPVERADAAEWIEGKLTTEAPPGIARVVMNSITYSYLSEEAKRRITQHMEDVGAEASSVAPLAWLAFELHDAKHTRLSLRTWPGGVVRQLAVADAHCRTVTWCEP